MPCSVKMPESSRGRPLKPKTIFSPNASPREPPMQVNHAVQPNASPRAPPMQVNHAAAKRNASPRAPPMQVNHAAQPNAELNPVPNVPLAAALRGTKHWTVAEDAVLMKHAVSSGVFLYGSERSSDVIYNELASSVSYELNLGKTAESCKSRLKRCLELYSTESDRKSRLSGADDEVADGVTAALDDLLEAKKCHDEAVADKKVNTKRKREQQDALAHAGRSVRAAALDEMIDGDGAEAVEIIDPSPADTRPPRNNMQAALAPMFALGQDLLGALGPDKSLNLLIAEQAAARREAREDAAAKQKEDTRRFDLTMQAERQRQDLDAKKQEMFQNMMMMVWC